MSDWNRIFERFLPKREPYPFEVGQDLSNGGIRYVEEVGSVQFIGERCLCAVGHEHQRVTGRTSGGISMHLHAPYTKLTPGTVDILFGDHPHFGALKEHIEASGLDIGIGVEKNTGPKVVVVGVKKKDDPTKGIMIKCAPIIIGAEAVLRSYKRQGPRGGGRKGAPETDLPPLPEREVA